MRSQLEPSLICHLCDSPGPDREPIPVEDDRDDKESSIEPAALCARVRALASQAHRTLTRTPCAPIEEIDDLRQQLADLRCQIDRIRRLHALRFDELELWLERLLERVQGHRFEASA